MVKNGDRVEIDGAVASVESVWAQGRHTQYKLSDGRTVLDLEALVKSGKAKVLATPVAQSQPRSRFDPRRIVAEDEKD